MLEVGARIAHDYAAGQVALPKRAHTSHLLRQFLWSQHRAQLDWATWAIDEVRAWPGTRAGRAATEQAREFFARAAARGKVDYAAPKVVSSQS